MVSGSGGGSATAKTWPGFTLNAGLSIALPSRVTRPCSTSRLSRERDRSAKWVANTRSSRRPTSSGPGATRRISAFVSVVMAVKLALKMRALKLLVIGLGVLLVAGIGALAAAVVWRINHDRPVAALSRATPTLQRIVLPAGAKVVATDVADGRLVARIELPGGGVRVLVVDLASGRPVATIDLAPPSP